MCYCTYPSGIYSNLTGSDSYDYYGVVNPPKISSTHIQGLYVGCMPYESLVKSTLECFYDDQLFANIENILSLIYDRNSVYSNDTKVDFLIQQLFIETISVTANFESFYSECKPTKCLYSYNSKGDVAFVILTILSLISGLFVPLKMISLFMVRFYHGLRRKCSTKSSKEINTVNMKTISNAIVQTIINLNLFEEAHNDEYRKQNAIRATRVYILSMMSGFTIIVLNTLISRYTLIYTVK